MLISRPDLLHEFSHWSGPAAGINAGNESADPLRFNVMDDIALTAHFVARQYELRIRNSESCADCGLPLPSGMYDPGDTATWQVTSPWPSESGINNIRYVAEVPSGSVHMDRDRTIELDWITQ